MDNNLLFCATDAGGARNLAPLISAVQSRGLKYFIIASKISFPIFKESNQNIKIEEPKISCLEDALEYLTFKKPSCVICGTTRYESPDRFLIAAAKQLEIKSTVILDEWFYYRLRFENKKGELAYLPDIICCPDKRAKEEAIAEGLPSRSLFITGSPALSVLTQHAESFLKKPPLSPQFLIPKTRPIITFISETHSVDYGINSGDTGLLGDFIGYTEHTVRNDIYDVLNKIGNPCTVIEKLHPSDKREFEPLDNNLIEWITLNDAKLWPLLWHSDLVIGMRSIALLESAILGCCTVSYQPNLIEPQMSTAVCLRLIDSIHDKKQLLEWLKKKFSSSQKDSIRIVKRFPFTRTDAIKNILHLAIKR